MLDGTRQTPCTSTRTCVGSAPGRWRSPAWARCPPAPPPRQPPQRSRASTSAPRRAICRKKCGRRITDSPSTSTRRAMFSVPPRRSRFMCSGGSPRSSCMRTSSRPMRCASPATGAAACCASSATQRRRPGCSRPRTAGPSSRVCSAWRSPTAASCTAAAKACFAPSSSGTASRSRCSPRSSRRSTRAPCSRPSTNRRFARCFRSTCARPRATRCFPTCRARRLRRPAWGVLRVRSARPLSPPRPRSCTASRRRRRCRATWSPSRWGSSTCSKATPPACRCVCSPHPASANTRAMHSTRRARCCRTTPAISASATRCRGWTSSRCRAHAGARWKTGA
jgi:hypothetical protein